MTKSQQHSVRLSEVRTRLNTIGQLTGDDYSSEIRSEEGVLQTEYSQLEQPLQIGLACRGRRRGQNAGRVRQRLRGRGRARAFAP